MKKLGQRGGLNVLLIPLILMTLFFIGAGVFGYWAYSGRQDYKNNTDQKIAVAVDAAKKQALVDDTRLFDEKEKQPLKSYNGPAAFGSLAVQYPKTWSAYVVENNQSTTDVDGYFHPGFVPGTTSGTGIALRIQVTNSAYKDELKKFDSGVKTGKVKVNPYVLPKVPGVAGARIDGQILQDKQGSMVLLPLRDKTLKIWTEADQFKGDFDGIILANFSFTP